MEKDNFKYAQWQNPLKDENHAPRASNIAAFPAHIEEGQPASAGGDEPGRLRLPGDHSNSSGARGTLQSWKEISAELQRGIRTLQRWERTMGLPIHRIGNGPRGPVFGFKDELRQWMKSKGFSEKRIKRLKNAS